MCILTVHAYAGRYDLFDSSAQCANCLTTCGGESLVRNCVLRRYWPGFPTQRGRYIYEEALFEYYDTLQKQCPGLSESGFLKSLENFSEAKGRVSDSLCAFCGMILACPIV